MGVAREKALDELATMLAKVTPDGRRVWRDGSEETRKPTRDETSIQDLADRARRVKGRSKIRELLDILTRSEEEEGCRG